MQVTAILKDSIVNALAERILKQVAFLSVVEIGHFTNNPVVIADCRIFA
jgi:hypothetical protein